jgi:hypothetical protein
MTTVLKADPFNVGEILEEGLDDPILSRIIPTINDEARHADRMKTIDDIPLVYSATRPKAAER